MQDLAIQILWLVDEQKAGEEKFEAFRQILLENPIEKVKAIYPEYFPADLMQEVAYAGAIKPDGTFDPDLLDDSKIQWRAEGITEDEDDELSRWIAEREMSLTLSDEQAGWR